MTKFQQNSLVGYGYIFVLLFTGGINQNICNYGHIVHISVIFSDFLGWLQKPKKVEKSERSSKKKSKKIVSLHANISDTPFDQKSLHPPGEAVLNYHIQTSENRDSLTESAYGPI